MAQPLRDVRVAFAAAAFVACAWLNQGPSLARYEVLAAHVSEASTLRRAWLPIAFLYRRSADEELYYAAARAILGRPYDAQILLAKRGEAPASFRRMPPADGRMHVPYTEVPLEYPPAALPAILLPAVVSPSFDAFARVFGALMGAFLIAGIALGARCRGAAQSAAGAWWLGVALLLAQGGLAVQRLDAVCAFFLAVGVWTAGAARWRSFGGAVGMAAAAKLTPLLALGPMWAGVSPRPWRPSRARRRMLEGLVIALVAGLASVVAIAPRGALELLRYHGARGLHVESTWGMLVAALERLFRRPVAVDLTFGSFNLAGGLASAMALVSTPCMIAAIVALTLAAAPRDGVTARADVDDAHRFDAARARRAAWCALGAVVAVWLVGKVFSPQYMTWAIPLVVAVQGDPRARRVGWLFVCALATTQLYLRGFYDQIAEARPIGLAVLIVRQALLVAMAVQIFAAIRSRRTAPARILAPARPAREGEGNESDAPGRR